jgi:glycoprotein endo-alpha-1,2-mannosidase
MDSQQDWFNWTNFIGEAGDHGGDGTDLGGGTGEAGDNNNNSGRRGSDWALTEIINDIELQMGEQNGALAGMTKQMDDLEVSMSLRGAERKSAPSSSAAASEGTAARFHMRRCREGGYAGDGAAADKRDGRNRSKGSIVSVLQRKSFVMQQSDDELEVSTTAIEVDAATTTSSSTRQMGNVMPIMEERRISIVKYNSSSGRELVPINHRARPRGDIGVSVRPGRIEPMLLELDEEVQPPTPHTTSRGGAFNMDTVTSENLEAEAPKLFESMATWADSESSNSESVVSGLEETVSGKTWAVRSRGAKTALVCFGLFLVLMFGLVIGKMQGGKSQQEATAATEQSSSGGFDAAQPVFPSTTPPQDATAVAEPTDAPVAANLTGNLTQAPVQPTSPPESNTSEPWNASTPFPTAAEEDNSTAEVITGYDYTANTDYLVAVYYYPWHGENFHNGGGYMRKELVPQHQPTLGEYNDSDPAVIAKHMRWFRQANIGLLVTSWWGPNGVEDLITKDVVMQHEDIGNLKIAIHYETAGRLGEDSEKLSNAKTDMEYMCEHYFNHPNFYKIDGRPVLFIYISRVLEAVGTLDEILLTMRSTASKCGHELYLIGDSVWASAPDPSTPHIPFWYFDAVTNYDVYGSAGRPEGYAGMERVDAYYEQQYDWKKEAKKEGCHYIPAVSPGYNDRGVRMEEDHPPLSRRLTSTAQEGSLFHYQLKHAKELVDKNLDNMIIVNSFNEWHEDTQIEPAVGEPATIPEIFTKGLEYVGYGELFLDILGAATSKNESQHIVFDYLFDP